MTARRAAPPPVLTRFVAFYSYKGGVGRTLALANCARVLAAEGKKIVLLDLDLEAPGLLHFPAFQPQADQPRPAGFAEYLQTCVEAGPPPSLDEYVHLCRGMPGDKGKTWLMPAGRHGEPGYLAFLHTRSWSDFYSHQDGYKILENLRGHLIHAYAPDYVLIDARTGLSEVGGIATHQLADIVVLVFNLNQQNLAGAKHVFDSIRHKAPSQPDIILVASPVPVMPTEPGTPFAGKMQQIAREFQGAGNADNPLVIPYHPLLAYDDRLLVDEADPFSYDTPYRRLTAAIQQAAQVDASPYLRQMTEPMQQGDWQSVLRIARDGLAKNPASFALLSSLASAHYFTGSLDQAVLALDEALQAGTTLDAVEIAKLLFSKSVALRQLDRHEEEIAVYNELLRRFGDAAEPALQEQLAEALFNKGVTLGQLSYSQAAIDAYDQLLQPFGDTAEPALQEWIARALFSKGLTFDQLGDSQAAIDAYDQLLQRFGDTAEPALQEQVVKALFNKGAALGQLGDSQAEIDTYDQLLQRFGDTTEPALQEVVAEALHRKATMS